MNDRGSSLRFVIVPKVAHPWFEEVRRGAADQARLLGERLGVAIAVEYQPPDAATTPAQDRVLARVVASGPAGIAVDPVDDVTHLPALVEARRNGIPVVVFDAPSPDPDLPGVGNDFAEQGRVAAERLVSVIGGAGEVAVMQGVPAAPNHRQRCEAQLAVLRAQPGITVVDGGVDHDDIATAEREAARVLATHPDLRGYLCCDASGPIGIAAAVEAAGRVGRVTVVGMDGIEPILRAVERGVLDSSVATIPTLQGSMALLMLWQAAQGMRIPRQIDTGIDVITRENVGAFLG